MFLTMRVLVCMWKWMSGSTWVYVFMNLCDWTCRNIHVIEWILVQVCTQWIYYSVTSYVYVFEYIYEHVPGKAMAPHSSTLASKIPWMEKSGGLQSMGSLRVGHDWVTSLSLFTFMHWRRKWQPTPVFLPGESQGPGSLVGCWNACLCVSKCIPEFEAMCMDVISTFLWVSECVSCFMLQTR